MQTISTGINSRHPKTFSLAVLAEKTGASLQGSPDILINGVGSIANAKKGEITFIAETKYRSFLASTEASAVIINPIEAAAFPSKAALISANPKLIFAQVIALLYPFLSVVPGRHSSAIIADTSDIHPLSYIGPHCVIGERVKIAANVVLHPGCVLGDDVEIGEGTVLFPKVSIYHDCKIGKACTVHSGVVIGSDGFGFAKNKDQWFKFAQIGRVIIGDRVEIGANTTIDRGAIEDTEIGDDIILDNLIQIAHNVKIGKGTAIAAGCAIGGSAIIGKHCLIGGGTCVVGHIKIVDFVHIVGSSNVGQSITQSGAYGSGITVMDIKKWKRNLVRHHQLDDLANRLFQLERKSKET